MEENKKKNEGKILNKEEEKVFWKTYDDSEVKLTDTDSYDLFSEFVKSQREGFTKSLNKVNDIFEKLKLEGKISEYAKWSARIKHFENAMKTEQKNYDEDSDNKALDDVFGVRIIGASKEEYMIIQKEIEKVFNVGTKRKNSANITYNMQRISEILKESAKEIKQNIKRNKKFQVLSEILETMGKATDKAKENLEELYEEENIKRTSRDRGYNAEHKYYFDKDDPTVPVMEFQYYTVDLDYECTYGKLSYSNYKDLSKKEIQKRYDNGEFRLGNNIPLVYESRNGKVTMLSSEEALKKTYPFLNMNKHNKEKSAVEEVTR